VLIAVGLTPLVLLAGIAISAELRARRLAQRLVSEAVLLSSQSRERPPHRAARPGSVTSCLERSLDSTPDVSRDVPWMSPALLQVRRGEASIDTLSTSTLEALTTHDPWLREMLGCSHFTRLELGTGLGPLAEPVHPRRQALPKLQEAAAALVPLRVRLLVQHGQLAEALEVCGDALAITADLLWLEGPEASLGSLGQATTLVPPCAEALWAADAGLVSEFSRQLVQLRANAPPYSRFVQLERLGFELRTFGGFVSPALATTLPPGPASMARTASTLWRGRLERVGLANWWSSADRAFTGVIAAADLAEPARTREILLAQRDFDSRWLRLVEVNPIDVRYQMYAESHEALPMALEVLSVVTGLRTGSPASTTYVDVSTSAQAFVVTPKVGEWRQLAVTLQKQ
jgi:hypothetical protein